MRSSRQTVQSVSLQNLTGVFVKKKAPVGRGFQGIFDSELMLYSENQKTFDSLVLGCSPSAEMEAAYLFTVYFQFA